LACGEAGKGRCRRTKEVQMPTWLLVLIIVLVILALFGGIGYRRW
jgi:hypothetical protein